jgi:ABC-2 type transport system ATP-binding protein
MSIQVEDVSKKYGNQFALQELSFSVGKGEVVGFLGPNGAGKSTTMKILTGYLKPDTGKAIVNGKDVSEHTIYVKRKIGYLSEANPLYYDMFIKEYLHFIARSYQITSPSKRIEDVIDMTGIRREAHKKTGQLSKGFKQRTGIAAALIHDPEVLILDEPTSGLDPNQVIEIRNIIKDQGTSKTILFSSHILSEVEAICKRVIIINKGKLVADNTLQQLIQQTGSMCLRISFNQSLPQDFFTSINGIESITQQDQHWMLNGPDVHFIRKQVMDKANDAKLDIVSMVNHQNQLEDIFRMLTENKN